MTSLVLFFEYSSSIRRGQQQGVLYRNMAQYERFLAEGDFKRLYWFSYDRRDRKILEELRGVKNWNAALDRIESQATVPEQQRLTEYTGIAEAEIRRAFPDLKYQGSIQNIHDRYQPLWVHDAR